MNNRSYTTLEPLIGILLGFTLAAVGCMGWALFVQ